jgi:hypothetical protein
MKERGEHAVAKYTAWFGAIGLWGGVAVATTFLGIEGMHLTVDKVIQLEFVAVAAMMSLAGIGLVFDLIHSTWDEDVDAPAVSTRGRVEAEVRKAA